MRNVSVKPAAAIAAVALFAAGLSLVACGGKDEAAGKGPQTALTSAPSAPLATPVPLEFKVVESTAGWGDLQVGKSVKENPLSVGGKRYASGLGTHSPAKIEISFPATFKAFSGRCGVDDEGEGKGTVAFKILNKEKVLFETPVVHGGSPALDFSVSVEGLSGLTLVVEDGGDGIELDHADWLDLKLK